MTAAPSTDVVCLGESMVTFVPTSPGRLADVAEFRRGIGGAESNVACQLARVGHRTRWVSRVGADGFGDHLVAAIAAHGVDTSAVRRDPHRPTGVYFRTAGERALREPAPHRPADAADDPFPRPGRPVAGPAVDPAAAAAPVTGPATAPLTADPAAADSAVAVPTPANGPEPAATAPANTGPEPAVAAPLPLSEVAYYRAGSAASAMSRATVDLAELWCGRVLHLSGITAALSGDCLDLLRELTARRPGRPLVSFDVNYRVGLWRTARHAPGPEVLWELARGCDLVFVGEDEAEELWGLRGPEALRAALPEPELLVVKQAGAGATACARHPKGPPEVRFEPAPTVEVVASVGAGDAFAAGFLSGTLRGLPVAERLRHGHLAAAATLVVPGDLGVPPSREVADRLVALDAGAWRGLRLCRGWTGAPPAGPESRTPAGPAPGTGPAPTTDATHPTHRTHPTDATDHRARVSVPRSVRDPGRGDA